MAARSPRTRPAGSRPRAFALLAAVVALALGAAVAAPLARALSEPPRLQDRVTDQADVLSADDEAEITQALTRLEDDHSIQLFVAFIDTTGDATVTAFTEDTAAASSLGGNDALLLVAVEDRSDAMWVGDALDEVTNDEIDSILSGSVEPRLADGDFAGAAVAGAEALGEASVAVVVPTVPPEQPQPTTVQEGGSTDGNASDGFNLTPVIAILLLLGGAFLIARTLLDRRARGRQAKATHDKLSQDANRALLASDEALKDAANDVEFAAAQWGEDEVTAYRLAIANATGELRTAFEIRQRLDDAEPETPPEQASMLQEILARTGTVQRLLDEQEQRFDQLRDLEQAAPAQLDALVPALAALRARQTAAAAEYERIAAAYAPSAVASVAGNAAEAAKALASAADETTRGRSVVATKRTEAVVALRRAQDGMARATRLIEAVERLGARLDAAAAELPAELAAAAKDVETAAAAVRDGTRLPPLAPGTSLVPPTAPGGVAVAPIPDPAAALSQAERLLGEARRAAESRPMDPLAALERATQANNAADAIIAGLREAEAQRTRRLQVAATAVASAHGHVTRAADYITTRRHGVGREARTRAAEAELRLEEAQRLAPTDPDAAIAAAQRATQLADEAYRLASAEFDGWDQGGGPVAGPYTRGGGGEAEVIGAVIGGVLGGILSSGGRGSGWGGSPWGGSSGGGGGFGLPGGGGGIGLPGPLGGGGGGGGGRVRGGRW
ncbi:MAG TPA: TPM domain-containing protein [Candidatus Limnocylindrales bacterium]|nr:TPM domain-containing protein [Candidatus Limnocylindrales bacterium]